MVQRLYIGDRKQRKGARERERERDHGFNVIKRHRIRRGWPRAWA